MTDLPAQLLTRYIGCFYQHPMSIELGSALRDSLSRGQLYSKIQAVNAVADVKEQRALEKFNAVFLGHWHGLLPRMFHHADLIDRAVGIEADAFWATFSDSMNYDWQWRSIVGDATSYTIPADTTLVVNTSCEHMSDDWLSAVPVGAYVCAQSTNYEHPTHINTVQSQEEFSLRFNNFEIIYSYACRYDVYDRFTIVAQRTQ